MIKYILELLKRIFGKSAPVGGYLPDDKNAPVASLGLPRAIVKVMEEKYGPMDRTPGYVYIVYLEGCDPDGKLNDDAPDRFNDSRICIQFVNNVPVIVGAWEATTEPSRHWTENRMNPLGAARIAFGKYKAWVVGIHNGHHEALVQRNAGKVIVYRDDNQDMMRPGDATQTGYFGINQHHGYDLPKNSLGRSSAGCLVGRTVKGHREFMDIVKSDIRYKANPNYVFETVIMDARDVL